MKLKSRNDFSLNENEESKKEKEMIYSVTVTGSESGMEQLTKILEYIEKNGNTGHSFTIDIDPDDSENNKKFGWDGDGSDRINEIKYEAKEKETEVEVETEENKEDDQINESVVTDLKIYSDYILKKFKDYQNEEETGLYYDIHKRSGGFAVVSKIYIHTDTLFNFKVNEDKFIIKLPKNSIHSGNSYVFDDYKDALDFGFNYETEGKNFYNSNDTANKFSALETKLAKKFSGKKK